MDMRLSVDVVSPGELVLLNFEYSHKPAITATIKTNTMA